MSKTLIIILVSGCLAVLAGAGCAKKKPVPNRDFVAKTELRDFQIAMNLIESKLKGAGITLSLEYKDGQITSMSLKPDDLSENAEKRIVALNEFQAFTQDVISRFHGKKVKMENGNNELISEQEKKALTEARNSASELVVHYQMVITYRTKDNYMPHRDYLAVAGKALTNAKTLERNLRVDYGITFESGHGLIERNVIAAKQPKPVFTEEAFVSASRKGIDKLIPTLTQSTEETPALKEVVERLKGKLVVADIQTFFTYSEEQTGFLNHTVQQMTAAETALKEYSRDLRESAEQPLIKVTELEITRATTIPENKGLIFTAPFAARFDATNANARVEALKQYKTNVQAFIGKYQKDGAKEHFKSGEFKLLESGLPLADRWIAFFQNVVSNKNSMTLKVFSEGILKPFAERQQVVEAKLQEVGINLLRAPITKNEDDVYAFMFDEKIFIEPMPGEFTKDAQLAALRPLQQLVIELRELVTQWQTQVIAVAPGKDIVHGERNLLNAASSVDLVDRLVQSVENRR